MLVLVTGGAGFIGARTAAAILATGDAGRAADVTRAVAGCAALVHAAGLPASARGGGHAAAPGRRATVAIKYAL